MAHQGCAGAALRCVFSSDSAVSSSIFVGAEREENLIRNNPGKSDFTLIPVWTPPPPPLD